MPLYSTGTAAKLAGVSQGTIRNLVSGQFSEHYAGLFSPSASPGKGTPRLFTPEDLKLLAFIRKQTETGGVSHAEVALRIRNGELKAFTWSPPAVTESAAQPKKATQNVTAGQQATQPPEAGTFALALVSQWASLLESARAREVDLQDRLLATESARVRAEAQLEAAQAQLDELKAAQARPWYKRLFGG